MNLTPHPLLRFLSQNPKLRRDPLNPTIEWPGRYRDYVEERLAGAVMPPVPAKMKKVFSRGR